MNTVYCLPLGESMREKFMEECRKEGGGIIVVPGNFIKEQVRNFPEVKAVNMDYLPNEILRANRIKSLTRISRSGEERLLQEIIAALLKKDALQYFREIAGEEGFIRSLVSLFNELASAGVEPAKFSELVSAWERSEVLRQKDKEIALLFYAYRNSLEERNLYDVGGMFRVAIEELKKEDCVIPWKKLYFSEFYHFDALQMEFIRLLSKKCEINIGLNHVGGKEPFITVTQPVLDAFLGEKFKFSRQDITAPAAEEKKMRVLRTASREEEIRFVLTDIKKKLLADVQCDDILVIVRNLDNYSGFYRIAEEYGIPVRLPYVTSLAAHPLTKMVTGLLAAAANPFDADLLKDLLRLPTAGELFHIDILRLIADYNQFYFANASSLRQFLRKRGEGEELFTLIDTIAKPRTPEDFVTILQTAFDKLEVAKFYGKKYQDKQIVLTELKALLEAYAKLGKVLEDLLQAFLQGGSRQQKYQAAEYLATWQGLVSDGTITMRRNTKKGIRIVEASNVQGVHFPVVYMLGMVEGEFPAVKQESWMYNDAERNFMQHAMGIELETVPHALATDAFFFASCTATAEKELVFSYVKDEENVMSSYLTSLTGNIVEEEKDNAAEALYSKEELLQKLASIERLSKKEKEALLDFTDEDFYFRKNFEEERKEEGSPYNGKLSVGDERAIFSASLLNTYISCPFSYLASRIWRTDKWEEAGEETEANVLGEMYHETLKRFLEKHLQENLALQDFSVLKGELHNVFSAVVAEFRQENKINASPFAAIQEAEQLNLLDNWLQKEVEIYQGGMGEKPFLPLYLEKGFGRKNDDLPALELEAGERKIRLTGQIDRIDSNGTDYIIYDYKSGSYPQGTDIKNGIEIQLPVYLLATENVLKIAAENIIGGGYVELKTGRRRGGTWGGDFKDLFPWMKRERPPKKEEAIATAKASIAAVAENLACGNFPASPVKECPPYCRFRDICRHQRVEEVKE